MSGRVIIPHGLKYSLKTHTYTAGRPEECDGKKKVSFQMILKEFFSGLIITRVISGASAVLLSLKHLLNVVLL